MATFTQDTVRSASWRTRTLAIGGVLGGVVGALASYLFVKSGGLQNRSKIRPDALLAVGMSVLALLQQFARLSDD